MTIEGGEAFLAQLPPTCTKLVYATLPWTVEEKESLDRILNNPPAPEAGEEESVQKRHRVEEVLESSD
jgi:hypothetical protein